MSEIAAIMIGDQFGQGIAAAYVGAGSVLALGIGWVLSRFDLTRWVEEFVFTTRVAELRADGHDPPLSGSGSTPHSQRGGRPSPVCG